MTFISTIYIVLIVVAVIILLDIIKGVKKIGTKTILTIVKSPAKAYKAIKEKRALVDKKEMKLRRQARDSYFDGEYLMIDKFSNDPAVKSHNDIKLAKENLSRHKESLKNKTK